MNLTAIIIVAIVCGTLTTLVGIFKKSNETSKQAQAKFSEHESSIEQKLHRMQERIEVLEKIVTDENYTLKREFSDL